MSESQKLRFIVGQRKNGSIEVQSVARHKRGLTMSIDFGDDSPESFVLLKTIELDPISGESLTASKMRAAKLFGAAQLSGRTGEEWSSINDLISYAIDGLDYQCNIPHVAELIERVADECELMKEEIPGYQRIRCVRYNESDLFEWLDHEDEIPKHAQLFPISEAPESLDIQLGLTLETEPGNTIQ